MKIYEFRKNVGEKLLIQFTEFRGKELNDLRVFYNAGEKEEDWELTPKGIFISRRLIPELKKGVDRAFNEWEKKARNKSSI